MDIIKTGWRATKGTVKAVHKLHKTAYKNAKQLSSKWNTNIKPLIMKFLKEFQAQLQIMWGKFRKYDKLYTKLGKEINSITQVYGRQMNSMRSISLFYHKFNPNALKGYAEAIKDYDAFMGAITGSTELFGGSFVPPKEFANYLRSKNIAKAKECVDSMSAGMSKLNSRGDLAFAYAIINDSDKNISKTNFRKIRECFTGPEPEQILKTAIKNKSPLVEFVQVSILRKEIEGKYSEKDVNKFKNDMLGDAGFLTVMGSVLNNKVIEKVLTGGGKSIKDQTREDMAAMEDIIRSGMSEQQNNNDSMSNKVEAEKDEKARQTSEVTGNNSDKQAGTTLEQEVKNAEGNTKSMQSGNQSEEFNPFGYDIGTEGFFDFFKSKKKEPEIKTITVKELNNIKAQMKTIYDKIYKDVLTEAKKLYPPKIVKAMYLFQSDEYNDYPSTTRATTITFQNFQIGAQDFIGDVDGVDDEYWYKVSDTMGDVVRNVMKKHKVEEINGVKFEWEDDDICVRAESVEKYILENSKAGNESEMIGSEGLVETITNYFRSSSAIQKAEAKKKELTTSLTLIEYKKAVEKFFLEHKKILENMLKPYSNAMKKYHVSINVPKYIEYNEVQDDAGGKLYIDFSKSLNYVDDYNDVDGEEIAKIIGIHPDGTDKFGSIIKKAFKDKFGFDLELDGDTDLVAFYTPDLNSIIFKVDEGTEGLFNFFKSKPKRNTITQSELDDILTEFIKIEKKIIRNTLAEWQKEISSKHIDTMGLELLLNDPYCQSIPKGSSSSRIEVSHFS